MPSHASVTRQAPAPAASNSRVGGENPTSAMLTRLTFSTARGIALKALRALRGEPITIYGDGKQVRDILHVKDAVAAYRAMLGAIERVSGRAFNLGGGPANAVSLCAVLDEIAMEDVVAALRDADAANRDRIGANARRIVLARHTGEARARELESWIEAARECAARERAA
jgi:nucleoside-diphosphate-sugar epimerase